MQGLHNDPKDETLHRGAIEKLAQELHRPIALVETVYAAEYARLKVAAKVPTYLSVFASRCTAEILLHDPRDPNAANPP